MITYRFLKQEELPGLYPVFIRAFSDYIVKMQLSEEQFLRKLQREGVAAPLTAAAFAEDTPVAFILTGTGAWGGKATAYNAGTGVVPEWRQQGIAENLYRFMLPELQQAGVKQCLLEVITENEKAVALYRKLGFTVSREFACYRFTKEQFKAAAVPGIDVKVKAKGRLQEQLYKQFWDVAPSWQNSNDSFKRMAATKMVIEAYVADQLAGYAILVPESGSVLQLAVHQEFRRQGVATKLFEEMFWYNQAATLSLINLDKSCRSFTEFLKEREVPLLLSQYEMVLEL